LRFHRPLLILLSVAKPIEKRRGFML
jgi:hypothetical protein